MNDLDAKETQLRLAARMKSIRTARAFTMIGWALASFKRKERQHFVHAVLSWPRSVADNAIYNRVMYHVRRRLTRSRLISVFGDGHQLEATVFSKCFDDTKSR